MNNTIPPMTDPMGRHWRQPKREDVEVDDTHALMTVATLNRLSNYSCTNPSGVYPGKMWRRQKDYYDESKGWLLVWYGECDDPTMCSNNVREILLADEPLPPMLTIQIVEELAPI